MREIRNQIAVGSGSSENPRIRRRGRKMRGVGGGEGETACGGNHVGNHGGNHCYGGKGGRGDGVAKDKDS